MSSLNIQSKLYNRKNFQTRTEQNVAVNKTLKFFGSWVFVHMGNHKSMEKGKNENSLKVMWKVESLIGRKKNSCVYNKYHNLIKSVSL